MNMTKRESNKVNCRERILKAFRRLFTSKGYEETMMEDIAQRAEVSKATVYNYFPNKESLLTGTVDEVLAKAETELESGAGAPAEQTLRRVVATLVIESLDYPLLARRISYLSSCETSTLYGTSKRMIAMLRTLAVGAQEEGVFRRDADPDDMVDVLMGLYYIAQFQWPDVGRCARAELKTRVDAFFTMMMKSFYTRG